MTIGKKVWDVFKKSMVLILYFTIWFFLLVIAYKVIAGFLGVDLDWTDGMLDLQTSRWLLLGQCVVIIVATYQVFNRYERPGTWSLGWKTRNALGLCLTGCLWGIGVMGLAFLGIWLAGGIAVEFVSWDQSLASLAGWIVLWAMVAISEEFVFRGYYHGLLKHHFGLVPATLLGSLLFAGVHLSNNAILDSPIPLLSLFFAGILFAVAREVSNNLWLPIGIHFTWNLFQGNVFGFAVSGSVIESSWIKLELMGSRIISGGMFGAEGSVVTIVVTVALTVVIWYWYDGRDTQKG